MPNSHFLPIEPLENIDCQYDGISLSQVTGKAIVSVARPSNGDKNIQLAVSKIYGAQLPDVGQSTSVMPGVSRNMVLFGLQIDQIFFYFDEVPGATGVENIRADLGNEGYYVDQSDSWVILKISGPKVRSVLERICLLDLSADKFAPGSVTRTQMEHLGVIIYHSGRDEFTLFAARSSAQSFHHTIKTSILNAIQYA